MYRILHVIDSAGLYGAEMVLLNLMEAQRNLCLHPMLLSLGDRQEEEKAIEIEAKRRGVETFVMRFGKGLNLKGSIRILQHAKTLSAQIIHSHGYKGNILLGLVPRALRRIPMITTLHGWTAVRSFNRMILYQYLDALAIRMFDKVVVVSSSQLQYSIFRILKVHPVVINNGIPTLYFQPEDFGREFPEVASLCTRNCTILSIGRLSPEKGFDVLIRSVAEAVSEGMDAYLALIGEGSEKPFLEKLVKLQNLSDRVFFLGYCEKAYQFMPLFDIFVLPSYTEGLPITLLEAMQAQVPIIGTDVGEIPKVLDNGRFGRLVPPGDSKALARAIMEVHNDGQGTKAKAIAARNRALTEYGTAKMATAYLEQYSTLLFKKTRSSAYRPYN